LILEIEWRGGSESMSKNLKRARRGIEEGETRDDNSYSETRAEGFIYISDMCKVREWDTEDVENQCKLRTDRTEGRDRT
jgi:hypothetical protein